MNGHSERISDRETNPCQRTRRRNGRASYIPLLVLSAVLIFSPSFAFSVRAEVAVGELALDLSFQGSDGKSYSVSGLLREGSKGVVLAFFPKAFTSG